MRYFEDVEVGETHEFGEYEVTEEEVVEFAEQYDPQPFHVDREAAADSMFGELVASGWHTAAMSMRLLVDGPEGEEERAAMGSPGVEELRWHQPVKPGDTLSVRTEVLEKRPSESREDRGYVTSRLETYNEDDELVMSWVADTIYRRRDAE
ncbi:MaoC family dehydratase [Natronococcus sp. A-GB1]|uniref:MaoC family dehydratase n=1 Tax=Natronococcus sp. A-GB1 TaxID=3037648 RepID=UPI00241FAA7E|nr:MaoC family dehydratase [Natronococcus sp. A-GB1]MDG5758979.1 MaoC family dehydratase [Natronococcus sp. A-GB1]